MVFLNKQNINLFSMNVYFFSLKNGLASLHLLNFYYVLMIQVALILFVCTNLFCFLFLLKLAV
jgi:hypothetical protein